MAVFGKKYLYRFVLQVTQQLRSANTVFGLGKHLRASSLIWLIISIMISA